MPGAFSQVSYWDRVAHEKRFSHPLRLDWLARYLTNPGARILDYGCGYGRTLAQLAVAGYPRAVGTDFSEAMLQRARREVNQPMLIHEPFTVTTMNGNRSAAFQYLGRKSD